MVKLKEIKRLLPKKIKCFVCAGHVAPDCDCSGYNRAIDAIGKREIELCECDKGEVKKRDYANTWYEDCPVCKGKGITVKPSPKEER